MKVYQHTITEEGIQFQMGLRVHQFIPFNEITSVQRVKKVVPNFSLGPAVPKEEPDNLYISAGENCNILVELEKPTVFHGMIKNFAAISCVWLSLENPEGFFNELSGQLGHD